MEAQSLYKLENAWRDAIMEMSETVGLPDEVQADELFLGGKQYHRALEFFKSTLLYVMPRRGNFGSK